MKEIREIGIEKEMFLVRGQEIKIPRLYGFPKDDFEFLVEMRSLPSDRLYPVYTTLNQEVLQNSLRANKFGMELSDTPSRIVSNTWVDKHWSKYDLYVAAGKDYTQNIYNADTKNSHHLGVTKIGNNHSKLTAGIHVHFSSRDSETGKVIMLPMFDIIKRMDMAFDTEITYAGRNIGEWESKPHGFEYRSLPANIDIYKVLKTAFEILRAV